MSKITADDIDLSKPVELIALSVKEKMGTFFNYSYTISCQREKHFEY